MIEGLIVDNFAGGGGASTGLEIAFGRSPDIAINHDPEAVSMHAVNHPNTMHLCQSVWKADPIEVTGGRPVALAWFSPDCKHFSKAKGGKPVEKNIRDLAWVVVHWAKRVKPAVIMLENVEEFKDWGPLITTEDGKLMPCPAQKGLTFKRWVRELKRLGYKVEWRELRACDYGAPTIRKRLFVIARCDGNPISWPKTTHGPAGSGLLPYRTAADCIDFSLPCPSIFDRKKALAQNTLRRVATGVKRYVIDSAKPFIIPITHSGSGSRVHSINDPLRTITTAHRGEMAFVSPTIVGCGGRAGQSRPRSADEPLATVTSKADACVTEAHMAPFIVNPNHTGPNYPWMRGQTVVQPLKTITQGGNSFMLSAPTLVQVGYGEAPGQCPRALDIKKPLGTIVAGGNKFANVQAMFMVQQNNHGTGKPNAGHPVDKPISTVTSSGSQQSIASAHMVKLRGTSDAHIASSPHAVDEPLPTVSADGQHHAHVQASLLKYYGTAIGADIQEPCHSVTSKDRFGLLNYEMALPPFTEAQLARARLCADLLRLHGLWDEREFITIEHAGAIWLLVDIGMRMLTRRELFNAQGFPHSYIIDRTADGSPLTTTASVRMCGNSVCPPLSAALARANFPGQCRQTEGLAA